jgi:Na+/proline symporter
MRTMLLGIAAIAVLLFLLSTPLRASGLFFGGPIAGSLILRHYGRGAVAGGMLGGMVGSVFFGLACFLHPYLHPPRNAVVYPSPALALPVFSIFGLALGLVVGVNVHLQFGRRAVGPLDPWSSPETYTRDRSEP